MYSIKLSQVLPSSENSELDISASPTNSEIFFNQQWDFQPTVRFPTNSEIFSTNIKISFQPNTDSLNAQIIPELKLFRDCNVGNYFEVFLENNRCPKFRN